MTGIEILLVLGMALSVYIPKVLPLALVTEQHAKRLRRWLVYVAPAVLGALVAPSIFAANGYLAVPGWDLAAYALAALVAATTRRLVTPLAVGVAALIVVNLIRVRG